MSGFIRQHYLSIAWAIVVLTLCNIPIGTNSTDSFMFFEGFDKLVHAGFFFILTIFVFYERIRQHNSYSYRLSTVVNILLLTVLFGGTIELLQLTVFTYRSAEWWDLFADVTGALMGVFSYVFLHKMHADEKPA